MRIAHFGTSDVESYGDLLFPLIVRRRLRDLAAEVVHVAPIGGPPVWDDCVPTVTAGALEGQELDGIVVGGGNVVHAAAAAFEAYRGDTRQWLLAYAELWFGASRIAAERGIPLGWNAPGVPDGFPPRIAESVRWAASVAGHVAVRDRTSQRNLRDAGVEGAIEIVPDPGFDVAHLFSAAELDEAYARAFTDRGRAIPDRTLAVHVTRRHLGGDAARAAALLDGMAAATGSTLVLVALDPALGDVETAQAVAESLTAEHVVPGRPASLREAVALLGRCDAYAGSSLHGLITALAFGRPGLVVAVEDEGGALTGLLRQFHLADRYVGDWAVAAESASRALVAADARLDGALTFAAERLDAHWDGVRAALAAGPRPPAEAPALPTEAVMEHAVRQLAATGARDRRRGEVAVEQRNALELRVDELEAEAAELRERYEAELAALRARVEADEDEIANRSARVGELSVELASVTKDLERQTKHAEGLSRLRGELEASLLREQEMEIDLRDARRRVEALGAELEAARERLREVETDREARLVGVRARVQQLESDLAAAVTRTADAEAAAAAARERFERASSELAEAQAEVAALASRKVDDEPIRARLAELEAEHEAALLDVRRELADRVFTLERAKGELVGFGDAAQRVASSRAWRFGHALMRTLRVLTFRRAKGEGAMVLLAQRARAAEEALALEPLARRQQHPGAALLRPPVPGAAVPAPDAHAYPHAHAHAGPGPTALDAFAGDPEAEGPVPPRDVAEVLRGTPTSAPDSVDVVVCVHDALEDVHRCLRSLLERTARPFRLIVVDDGSGPETAGYLDRFAAANPAVDLRRNAEPPHGYTIAANMGLRASTADLVVLLNSDTIVTRGWLDRLLEAGAGDERVGIVGPLSNAATHQSVPEVRTGGEWAVNAPPEWLTEDGVALVVGNLPGEPAVRVPFLNGFCYAVRRRVLDAVGLFDEEQFAAGYSEENDFSVRAADAGFELAVATRAYVFHAKSRSYGHAGRKELAKRHYAKFLERHGEERVRELVARMDGEAGLTAARARVGEALASPQTTVERLPALSVTFVLPGMAQGGSGGSHSIYQEVSALRSLGVAARIAVPGAVTDRVVATYPGADAAFVAYEDGRELAAAVEGDDVIVATHYKSVPLVARLLAERPGTLGAYYVQDYEPLFAADGSLEAAEAERSYRMLPGGVLFAKTDWLCTVIAERAGVPCAKVEPSLDHDVFHPRGRAPGAGGPVHLVAMIRPRTPRRAPAETLAVLERLAAEHGDGVRITTFGCDRDELDRVGPAPRGLRHAGLLGRAAVADLFRTADVFLDCSWYQAFGRTGLEAMACGSTAVLPRVGGVTEFARHEENCLLADTWDVEATAGAVSRLLADAQLRARLQAAAVETASGYSAVRAALSEYTLFCHEHALRAAGQDGGRRLGVARPRG